MLKQIIIFMTLCFLVGCDWEGAFTQIDDNQPSEENQTPTVSGQFIDEPVEGLIFECSSGLSGATDSNGTFTCHEDDTVTFKIGSVILGSSVVKDIITPLHLYQNISKTEQAYNIAQLLHSLDNDHYSYNGIQLNTEISLDGINIDMDSITFENALASSLAPVGIAPHDREQAIVKMLNYIFTHDDGTHYGLSINIENELKAVESQMCSSSQKLENAECIDKTCETDAYNCPIEAKASSEPFYDQQWYLDENETFYLENSINSDAHIHSGDLLNNFSGKGIKIAVIDDGLDVTHEDLTGAIIATYDVATKTSNVAHTNHSEHHGTAVTGIIGARINSKGIAGVASTSQIIFLKHKENMSDSETIELFNKAEELGADIINSSWGTYDVSDAVKDKIVDLANNGRGGKGTIIIFATGNDDQDMGNDESAIPEVISVGSTDKDNLRAWYSNYGPNIDVVAPGGYGLGITTLDTMGSDGIASIDDNYLLYNDGNSFIGTSASAPIVSGVIALILEQNPSLTRVEIENILKNTSDKIGNVPYDEGRNDYYGYGKVNLSNIFNH